MLMWRTPSAKYLAPDARRRSRSSSLSSILSILAGCRLEEETAERTMAVRIRLSRFGCSDKPFNRVMAAQTRPPLETATTSRSWANYNPLPGPIIFKGKKDKFSFSQFSAVFDVSIFLCITTLLSVRYYFYIFAL